MPIRSATAGTSFSYDDCFDLNSCCSWPAFEHSAKGPTRTAYHAEIGSRLSRRSSYGSFSRADATGSSAHWAAQTLLLKALSARYSFAGILGRESSRTTISSD